MFLSNANLLKPYEERIKNMKNYFENNSFTGSQFFKWTEEFKELLDALDEYKKLKEKKIPFVAGNITLIQKKINSAVKEMADELITRIQWDDNNGYKENSIKKLQLEGVYELYCELSKGTSLEEAIEEKILRTEDRIKTGYYKQYLKNN